MRINILWNFRETIKNIRALKEEYLWTLTLFSWKNAREKTDYIQRTRNKIYSLQLMEWQKDKLWEYMNDDVEFSMLISIANRQKYF